MSDILDTSRNDETLRRKKADRKRERELNDIRKVLSSAEGRRLLWRILAHAGLYRDNDATNSTAFRVEGRRSEGLFWLGEIMTADHKAFAAMQSDHYSEAQSEKALENKEQK